MNPDLLNLSTYRVLQVDDADGDYQIKAETLSPPDPMPRKDTRNGMEILIQRSDPPLDLF